MKKILNALLLAVCFPAVISLASDQIVEEVPLHIDVPAGGGPHAPAIIPISCHVSSSMNKLFVSSNYLSCAADIVIINETTTDILYDTIQLGALPEEETLFGPGDYSVTITLASGVAYYGDFNI